MGGSWKRGGVLRVGGGKGVRVVVGGVFNAGSTIATISCEKIGYYFFKKIFKTFCN